MPPTTTRPSHRTLRQVMVLRGYDRPADLVRAAAAAGTPVPQPAVSALLAGGPSYPRAREAVAATLGITVDQMLRFVRNSALEAARRLRAAK